MVKGVTDGPRIQQYPLEGMEDKGPKGTGNGAKSDGLTLPQLNGILDLCGLETFGGGKEPLAKKGTAEDAPRHDGPLRNRSDDVKSFFKAIGKGLDGFFAKIGNAFKTGFDAIKEAVTAKTGAQTDATAVQTTPTETAPTPKPTLDKPGVVLKEFCERLGEDLETDYQSYLATSDDDPKMGRIAYVEARLPEPQGGSDGIDRGSDHFIGDRLDDVRANIGSSSKPGVDEMRKIAMDRLAQFPTLDIAVETLFNAELDVLENPLTSATFLRGNSAYTRMDKYLARATVPFEEVAQAVITDKTDQIQENGHLGKIDGVTLSFETLTREQADAVLQLGDSILTDLLDTDPDKPDSFFSSIPTSYREHLADKADKIMGQEGVPLDQRQGAVKMMYANSLFLRGIVGDLTVTASKTFAGTENQSFAIKTMQFVQTFLNGVDDYGKKANEHGVDAMNQTKDTHQSRFDAFLKAVGMPDFGPVQIDPDHQTVTE